MAQLFRADGRPYTLGNKLGAGGEGDVYDVVDDSEVVAKLYHSIPNADKQQKLRLMTEHADRSLLSYAAWPTATLHRQRGGPTVGFLMPKVAGYEPIHKLYSPAHRKQLFPTADWSLLVHVARNLCASFAAVHSKQFVIGDVNQGNVVIAKSGVVRLIDCDSFQVTSNGRIHYCEVGVAHFTPPELQSVSAFGNVRRTSNHDCFGLAVLCFHVLFMGRHPFAGVYSGKGDMPIEKAIQSHRFAFGINASKVDMSPPPNSVAMQIVTPQVAELFERAFSASAVTSLRPSAMEWYHALGQLQSSLKSCTTDRMHRFYGGIGKCPWCDLEQRTGILFFVGAMSQADLRSAVNIAQLWNRILAITPPETLVLSDPSQMRVRPRPLPPSIAEERSSNRFIKTIAIVVVVGSIFVHPAALVVAIVIAVILFNSCTDDTRESRERKEKANAVQSRWNDLVGRVHRETSQSEFGRKREELDGLRKKYEGCDAARDREIRELHNSIRADQLHRFLDGICLDDHSIPRIGPTRKATLASFGVETAADIDRWKILKIPGFGESLTDELMRWKQVKTVGFVFDASKGVDPADVAAVEKKYAALRNTLGGELLAGAERLVQIRNEANARRRAIRSEMQSLAIELAQAKADLAVA